jgi:hypothetical protein
MCKWEVDKVDKVDREENGKMCKCANGRLIRLTKLIEKKMGKWANGIQFKAVA